MSDASKNNSGKKLNVVKKLKAGVFTMENSLKKRFSDKGPDIYSRFFRRLVSILIITSLLAAVIIIITVVVARIGAPITKVPAVIGKNVVEAAINIEEKGLVVEIDSKFDETSEKFMVLEQFPKPGITVKQGRTVKILVGMGKDEYEVPELVGMDRDEAEQLLRRQNIPYEITIIQSKAYRTNSIISQDIPAGRKLPRSAKVKLLVNSDVGENEFRLEDYIRKPVQYAVSSLFDNGMTPNIQKSITTIEEEDGMVMSQSIPPGTVVQKNSSLDLQVAVYGEDEEKRQKSDFHVFRYLVLRQDDNTNTVGAQVKVMVVDEEGQEREVYNQNVRYGQMITVIFKALGRARLSVIINNQFVEERSYGY